MAIAAGAAKIYIGDGGQNVPLTDYVLVSANYTAMVSELDAAIGRLVDALDEEGLLGETLVWFLSDNGGLNPAASGA